MDSTRTNKPFLHSLLVLGKSLGSGAFGTVHEARWGNQPCAAKSFFISQSDFHLHAIQKEISVLQTLRYRHVIQFYRTHEEDGRIYLLMELAEKGSLARAITKGELGPDDWATKKRLASEIARGLAFIHQERVLHRDLKSANVLLTKHMEVKLADFGLAKVRAMASAASTAANASGAGITGTLRWIAPELLFGSNRVYSTKSDVYALGVVMWEMAANCTRPFKDQYDDALVALDVRNGCREHLPEDTPIDYRRFVEQCWDQDPQKRPDASEVAFIQDEPVSDCSGDDEDTTIDMSFSHSSLGYSWSTHGDNDSTLDNKAALDDTEQHVGQILSMDDDVEGARWLRKAAEQGDVTAQFKLAVMYDEGKRVEQSDLEAVKWYTKAAEQGDATAQFKLAVMYDEGKRVEQSDVEAVKWFTKAAEQGNAKAQGNLAVMYRFGRGVEQSDAEAVKWYTKAAEQGDARAQFILGVMYDEGRSVEKNDVEAVKWYVEAARQGIARAQHNLAVMYRFGRGMKQIDAETVKLYTKLAEQGDARAYFCLGVMYERGQGVEQSYVEAVKWYTKAAEQGNALSQCNLAMMYDVGRGVEQSDVEASKWYTKAAEQGDERAQFNLGIFYSFGRGVEQNYVEAIKWYTKAAEQGDADAQYNLGLMYDEGQGVEQSKVEAVKWYTKAARQGNAKAQDILGIIL